MAEAETSSAKFAYSKESTYGTNPGTGAKFARITSEDLDSSQSFTKSEEVNGDRNPRQNIRTSRSVEGSVNFEFAPDDIDAFILEGAMMATPPAVPSLITGSLQAVASTQKITSSGTPSLAGISKGQWVRLSGFTAPANNGIFVAAAASTSTELTLETGSGIVDEASAAGRNVQPSVMVRPGSTKKSFSLERQWTDIAKYREFRGMRVGGFSLSLSAEQVITGSVQFMGGTPIASAGSSGMGTIAAAGTKQVVSVLEALRGIREASLAADATHRITELSLDFSNALRMKRDVQSLDPFDIGLGIVEATLQGKMFLQNMTLIDKFIANTATLFSFRIVPADAADATYIFTLPKLRLTAAKDAITGNSTDGFVDFTGMAETDANGVGFQIDKLPAIP